MRHWPDSTKPVDGTAGDNEAEDRCAGSRFESLPRLPQVTATPPFEEVVKRHGPTVLRVCRSLLAASDAEDAWSDTFLAALEAYPRLPGDANVEAWLVTIAHRKAIDVLRRLQRSAAPRGEVAADTAVEETAGRDLDLVRSLAALPDRQRFAVVYHYLAGLPYAEVAEIVGGTPAAARRAAADGIANLRTNSDLRLDQGAT